MTWKDFQVMVVAAERSEVNGWRKARFLGYMMYVTQTADKHKKSIEHFFPLPGDPVHKPPSPETLLNTFKKMGIGNFKA